MLRSKGQCDTIASKIVRGSRRLRQEVAPRHPMNESNADDAPGAEGSDLKGLRVLLVEDSWHLGVALKELLRAWGADVAGPVATTAEAERLISEYAPDVAVVDINLRGGER